MAQHVSATISEDFAALACAGEVELASAAQMEDYREPPITVRAAAARDRACSAPCASLTRTAAPRAP